MREIVAAWICCTLLAFGAALGELAVERHPLGGAYSGMHILGGGGPAAHGVHGDEDRDDPAYAADRGTAIAAQPEASRLCAAGETPYSPRPTMPARSRC